MFLARFTRPDISFPVSILSTRCAKPTRNDLKQAVKVLKYVAVHPDYAIVYKSTTFNVDIYADASHGIHPNGTGQGCIIVRVGTGMVFIRSYKLKMVTLSSTESEWLVLCEATQFARWLKDMLHHIGISITSPIKIRQDNTSTIWLAENGANFARTKHLLIKRNYAKEGILDGVTSVVHTSNVSMFADLGTKVLALRMIAKYMIAIGMMIPSVYDGIFKLVEIPIPVARTQHQRDTNNKDNSTSVSTSRTNLPITNTSSSNASKSTTKKTTSSSSTNAKRK
jgi:hypothetical protein